MRKRQTIKELGLASTAYGISNILRSKRNFHKILWIFFILISTTISCWFVYDALFNFLEYKVVTLVQSVYEQPTQFPTISFCSYSKKDAFTNKKLKDIFKGCCFNYDFDCQYNPENYFEPFVSYYGQCYRFNSGKNFKGHSIPILNSTIAGLDDSFYLTIDPSLDMVLWVHSYVSPPILSDYNNHFGRIFASAYSYTQLIIDRTTETKLSLPYNDCLNDVTQFKLNKTIIDYILSKNEIYSRVKCLELCFDLEYIENNQCQCSSVTIGNVWQQCWLELEKKNQSSCTWYFKQNFYTSSITEKCAKYCPLECTQISYSVEISSIHLVNSSLTKLKVFYRSLKFTSITQEPKILLIDLVSNIGGTFGLFVGVSFVTIIEIIEVLTELVFLTFEMKTKVFNSNH